MSKPLPRRDTCWLIGRRAQKLNKAEAAAAWDTLGRSMEAMGDLDIPKFSNLRRAIRMATIVNKGTQLQAKPNWVKHEWDPENPLCVRCGTQMYLMDGCQWDDVPHWNMCCQCAVIIAKEVTGL